MSNLEPKPWHCCLDCQDTDFGGWPVGGELPIKILTNELRYAMLEKCTRLSNPNLPSNIPWENQKVDPPASAVAGSGATDESAAAGGDVVRYLNATEVTECSCYKECGLNAGVELDSHGISYKSCFDCLLRDQGEIPNAPAEITLSSNVRAHMLDYCTRKDEISFPESLSFGQAEEEERKALVRYPMNERKESMLKRDKAPWFLTEPPLGTALTGMSVDDVATDKDLEEAGRVKKLTPRERVARHLAAEGFIPKTDDRSPQETAECAIHAVENSSKNRGRSKTTALKNCTILPGTFIVLPVKVYENGKPGDKDYYKNNLHVKCTICRGNISAAGGTPDQDFNTRTLKSHAPKCLALKETGKLTDGNCGCGLGIDQFKDNKGFTTHAKSCTGNTCPKCKEPYDVLKISGQSMELTGEMSIESVEKVLKKRNSHRKSCNK